MNIELIRKTDRRREVCIDVVGVESRCRCREIGR